MALTNYNVCRNIKIHSVNRKALYRLYDTGYLMVTKSPNAHFALALLQAQILGSTALIEFAGSNPKSNNRSISQ